MTWASAVPDTIGAIVAAFTAWPALEGTEIIDGPQLRGTTARERIAVGFSGEHFSRTGAYPEPFENAVTAALTDAGLAGLPQEETFSVHCAAWAATGTTDIVAARVRVYDLFAAAGAALAADPKLGGAVMRAVIGASCSLRQDQVPKLGAVATVLFDVDCRAFTRR